MAIRINTHNLPPLCSFALGAALVLLLGGAAWWFAAKHEQQEWQSTYGRTLAVLTAKSAIDATLNHDLVSLQVVLQDTALSRYVSLATIHDVENKLLVQAGEDPSQHLLKHLPAFSAAISFQQNIAGYVTVYLDNPPATKHFQGVMLGGLFLLLLIAGLSLLDNFRQVFEIVEPELEGDEDFDDAHLDGENSEGDADYDLENAEGDKREEAFKAMTADKHNAIAIKVAAAINASVAIKAHTEDPSDDVDLTEKITQNNALFVDQETVIDEDKYSDDVKYVGELQADNESPVNGKPEVLGQIEAINKADSLYNLDDSAAITLPAYAELMVYIQNFGKLQQTLSADLTAQIIQQLMVVSERAMKVYGATWSKPPELTLKQGFLFFLLVSDQSEEDALETAVLLGSLIKQAFKPHKIKIQLDLMVAMQNDFSSLMQRPNSSFAVHLPRLSQQMALFERMHFSLLDEYWYELVNLDEPYQTLLSDQALQLAV